MAALSFALSCHGAQAHAQWVLDGNPLTRAAFAQSQPALIADGAGSLFAAWVDARTGTNSDIYAQRFDALGSPAPGWLADGNAVTQIGCAKFTVAMAPDGTGGTLLAWSDDRCQSSRDIYAAKLTAAGALAPGWAANGAPACLADDEQSVPVVTDDGAGGAFIAWQDRRYGYYSIHAQHLSSTGVRVPGWPSDGLRVCGPSGDQTAPAVVADGAGGAFFVWEDRRGGSSDIYAQHFNGDGMIAPGWTWSGQPVCTASGGQLAPVLLADGAGGFYVAWIDRRAGDEDIYVLRMSAAGVPSAGWPDGGLAVCASAGVQEFPAMIADGTGGVIVAWQDGRAAQFDIYAERLSATGNIVSGWLADGTPLCVAPGDQVAPQLTSDMAGGVIAAWQDHRSGTDHIYAQHVDGAGAPTPEWPVDGLAVCTANGNQQDPRVTSDGSGGAFVAWVDSRAGSATAPDLYATRILGTGLYKIQVRGLEAHHHDGQTFLTWTSPAGTGWTYRAYRSSQPIVQASDLTVATLLGTVSDSTWCDRRLSGLLGETFAYRTDSLGPELEPWQSLFVSTPAADGSSYYAVTAQHGAGLEDRLVIAGENALSAPVAEWLGVPRPVFQRTVTLSPGVTPEIYALWTTDRGTPLFPAMANRPGMVYDCAVRRGGTRPFNSLLISLHQYGGSLLNGVYPTGYPGEWVLGPDDFVDTRDRASFWYGYHEQYDITLWHNPAWTTGEVCDFTDRRLVHTLRWACRNFDLDTTRVYETGYSMGAIGDFFFALHHPEMIAALMTSSGKFDFSYLDEPYPTASYNPGMNLRDVSDRLWGTVGADLPLADGDRTYEQLNASTLVAALGKRAMPPMVTFSGKNDTTMGWAEKLSFYRATQIHRQGGFHFFDPRSHAEGDVVWGPMWSTNWLYRMRTDLSFPAFSNCSTDNDPGDGSAASGDSVGTFNGPLDWDPAVIDLPQQWAVTLSTRDLAATTGTLPAPDSVVADVTPRRLQSFLVTPDTLFLYEVVRSSDGALVQSGVVLPDSIGLLTVPGVKIYHLGSRLTIKAPDRLADVAARGSLQGRVRIVPPRSPLSGAAPVTVVWPHAGEARLDLLDAGGRRVRSLFHGSVAGGSAVFRLESSGLASSVYFLQATQGPSRAVSRVVVLR